MLPEASTVSTSATSTRWRLMSCAKAAPLQIVQARARATRMPCIAVPHRRKMWNDSSRSELVGQFGGKPRRAQIGSQRILQQLHDLGRLRLTAVSRTAVLENLRGSARQLEGNAELLAHAHGEAEILAGEVHGEADVVAVVQDQLALGLVHVAVAGAGADGVKRLGEVEPAPLCQHQR